MPVPVTADVEAGYRLLPTEVVGRLLDAGAVGCNLEDTDHHGGGGLIDADSRVERLGAVRSAAGAAGVDIVLNARIDVLRLSGEPRELFEEAVRRARLYIEAGADCVFPIRLADDHLIAEFVRRVDGPVNVVTTRDPALARLGELGVRRISFAATLDEPALRCARGDADRHRSGAQAMRTTLSGRTHRDRQHPRQHHCEQRDERSLQGYPQAADNPPVASPIVGKAARELPMHCAQRHLLGRVDVPGKQVIRVEAERKVVVGPQQDRRNRSDEQEKHDGDPFKWAQPVGEGDAPEQGAGKRRREDQRTGPPTKALHLGALLDKSAKRFLIDQLEPWIGIRSRTSFVGHAQR